MKYPDAEDIKGLIGQEVSESSDWVAVLLTEEEKI